MNYWEEKNLTGATTSSKKESTCRPCSRGILFGRKGGRKSGPSPAKAVPDPGRDRGKMGDGFASSRKETFFRGPTTRGEENRSSESRQILGKECSIPAEKREFSMEGGALLLLSLFGGEERVA